MFKDRVFNVAFLASFLFHVFCIFFIVLVIKPNGFKFNNFTSISFLGPILEQNISVGYNLKPTLFVTPYKEDFTFNQDMLWKNYDYLDARALADNTIDQVEFKEPQIQKQIPDFTNSFLKSDEAMVLSRPLKNPESLKNLKIEGPLASRGIAYSPVNPALPKWAKESDMNFSIDLKISVSGNGAVQSVNRLTTTGYPEIDLIAIKYASSLIFQPLYESAIGVTQEGKIKVTFNSNDKT